MNKVQISLIMLVIVAVGAVAVVLNKNNESTTKTIKIGAVLPLTGSASFVGNNYLHGMQIAVEELNSTSKNKFELVAEDGQAAPPISLSASQKLTAQNIPVILTALRGASLAIASPLKDKSTIVLTSSALVEGKRLGDFGNNFMALGPEIIRAGGSVGEYAKNTGSCKSYGEYYENTDASKDKVTGFSQAVATDGNILVNEPMSPDEKDYKTLITKAKGKSIDCLFVDIRSNNMTVFLKQMEELNYHPMVFTNSYSINGGVIKDAPASQISKTYYSISRLDSETGKTFEEAYMNKFNSKPDDFAGMGYEMAKITGEAMLKCGEDTSCISKEIRSVKDRRTFVGTLSTNENGEMLMKDYRIMKIVNGEAVEVK